MIRSYVSGILCLIFFVLLESALLANISFFPAFPDFVMMFVLYFSVRNGKVAGQTMGFAGGLLLDLLSGAPFGMSCVVRTILGYAGGIFHNLMNYQSFFVNMVAGFLATLAKAALIYGISLLFPRHVNHYHIFSSVFALELALNTVFTPIVFRLLRPFDSFIVAPDRRLP
ncbi:MAG: rod shape-determining protein MreD [Treponema sp.]|nr:rod shape-determining protein MreD [Treponema sp.]